MQRANSVLNQTADQGNLLAVARQLIVNGYSVVPIREGTKAPRGLTGWQEYCSRQATDEELQRWFALGSGYAGLGIACGYDGLIAVDLDTDDTPAWQAMGALLPPTVRKRGNKGFTAFVRCEIVATERINRIVGERECRIVDVIGAGGQTVIPPSFHADTGRPYVWGDNGALLTVPLASLPMVSADIRQQIRNVLRSAGYEIQAGFDPARAAARDKPIATPASADPNSANHKRKVAAAQVALEKECAALAVMTGGRNDALNAKAYRLGRFVGAGAIDVGEVRQAFEAAYIACADPGKRHDPRAFERTFRSGLEKGMRDPITNLEDRPAPGFNEMFANRVIELPPGASTAPVENNTPLTPMDFFAYMPTGDFIFRKGGAFWKAVSVDRKLPKIQVGTKPDSKGVLQPVLIPATTWIAQNNPVHQLAWYPGEGETIEDVRFQSSDFITEPGFRIYNSYEPPKPEIFTGNWSRAKRWTDHIDMLWPGEAADIVAYFAHAAQRPDEKCNHALFLGGRPRTGKDSILEPLVYAVGSWNVQEVSPEHILTSQFNDYLKTVVLRISEAKDLGEHGRFRFYEKMKTVIAAPPNVHTVNEKHIKLQAVVNINRVIYTSNHLEGGLYLRPDDERHLVCWSELSRDDIEDAEEYFRSWWHWLLNDGGLRDCATYLKEYNLHGWNAKAPPRKTQAFYDLVDAGKSNEAAPLEDLLERMGWPTATTIERLTNMAMFDVSFKQWLSTPSNSKQVVHMLRDAGYVAVRNPHRKDGRWRVGNRPSKIYVNHRKVSADQRLIEAQRLAGSNVVPLTIDRNGEP